MESVDGYLHKKFKKQVSIDQHKRISIENAVVAVVEKDGQNDEETKEVEEEATNQKLGLLQRKDNNLEDCGVPNQSTNLHSTCSYNLWKSSSGFKSSISSLEQPSSSSISQHHQHQNQYHDHRLPEPITLQPSSILDNLYKVDKTTEDISLDTDKPVDRTTSNPTAISSTSGTGKYVCTYCNLVCSKPSVLQKHIRAHTNERPYPCNSCGFSFKTRSNLYKHCRSRTHANRVLGNNTTPKIQEVQESDSTPPPLNDEVLAHDLKTNKPYKPRFHTNTFQNPETQSHAVPNNNLLSDHINDIISKNNSIVNDTTSHIIKKKTNHEVWDNNNDYVRPAEEPLNLTKNRKRCMSEVVEPTVQKSLIKELLLKNLNSDMQCPHCKMIFQTVTELELHKLRSCKGFVHPSAKYSRSSSVNVASILTQNKNAFDGMPYGQNTLAFKSSSVSFLAKARSEKSFSFDDTNTFAPITFQQERKERKIPVKLFGGEVKITQNTGETTSYKIDAKEPTESTVDFTGGKLTENRVVKSGLQSGGTVLTNKTGFAKTGDSEAVSDVIRVYTSSIDLVNLSTASKSDDSRVEAQENIDDFSQKAVKLLTPNLRKPNFAVPGVPVPNNRSESRKLSPTPYNPVNLLVDGRVVRYVPGIPGPVIAEEVPETRPEVPKVRVVPPPKSLAYISPEKPKQDHKLAVPELAKTPTITETKKFSRPNSLALKPSTASLKQHHGLTPTMFNQILISPDTPRVAKKYVQQYLHGNYFSYLGLKSSTKPVYCTLNKTQPFYVPHFKKLSMYSEWRQQDTKTDKLYVSAYDSRQKMQKYTSAGNTKADLVVHSSYKFSTTDSQSIEDCNNEEQKNKTGLLGGYESNEDYTYIRGRGRGRYVCEQCGIRCKKPSMLKKHIRTHSNDRPYTCNDCNFSFKTKGNLTKHMKSKAHSKNTTPSGSGSSTQQSGTQSSDSDTDDSGMDSSDESTRREEHEAAYGLLSLSQKTPNVFENHDLDDSSNKSASENERTPVLDEFLGKSSTIRSLTYPYTSAKPKVSVEEPVQERNIQQFHVIQKYAPSSENTTKQSTMEPVQGIPGPLPVLKVNDSPIIFEENRKRKISEAPPSPNGVIKVHKNEEVIDLSVRNHVENSQNSVKYPTSTPRVEYDNSAMETLADIATKQVKLEKNTLAKSVASEFLKIATKHDQVDGRNIANSLKEMNELIVKPEGSRSCHICGKSFNKTSQLRLHMNIHYLERPFRCHSCAVSFRTKGHLLKHERSAGHNNKLSSSPTLALTEPRPFKCIDCNIAFRIHGHLAKHLRSKMHIMKLECLAKIPFGLYAELERSNSLLTEINTADGDQCLESLKNLAKKVFVNDPTKLNHFGTSLNSADLEHQQCISDVDVS